jgi:hypothetical protein
MATVQAKPTPDATVSSGADETVVQTTTVRRVAPKEETKAYRYNPLVPGARHFAGGDNGMEEISVGDVVHLTKRQALAFADRFIPNNPNDSFTPGVTPVQLTKPLPNSDEPQDQSAKTPDPRVPPGSKPNVPAGSKATE